MLDGVERLLVIRLAGKRVALDVSAMVEVAEMPEIWPIPLAPDFFRGVMNSHGNLIPLLDLASYLGVGTAVVAGKSLLLDRSTADLALLVDDVERVVPAAGATVLGSGQAPFVAVLEIFGEEMPLISPSLVVEMLEADLRLLMQTHFAPVEETS